jgi:hypothetical protein
MKFKMYELNEKSERNVFYIREIVNQYKAKKPRIKQTNALESPFKYKLMVIVLVLEDELESEISEVVVVPPVVTVAEYVEL